MSEQVFGRVIGATLIAAILGAFVAAIMTRNTIAISSWECLRVAASMALVLPFVLQLFVVIAVLSAFRAPTWPYGRADWVVLILVVTFCTSLLFGRALSLQSYLAIRWLGTNVAVLAVSLCLMVLCLFLRYRAPGSR
jgi:hypothetical protein